LNIPESYSIFSNDNIVKLAYKRGFVALTVIFDFNFAFSLKV